MLNQQARLASVIGAGVMLLGLNIPVTANTTENFQFRGQNASAGFYQEDACSYTSFYVWAADSVSRSSPGAPTTQKEASISYSKWDQCAGTYSYGYGSSSNVDFNSNRLDSATLNGTFTVSEYQGRSDTPAPTKTINVALTLTGVGDTFRGNSSSHYQWMGGISRYRYTGSYRNAEVKGSITMDGMNQIATTSSYGELSTVNSGSGYITRK